ncbi:MAG: hypoxanthine phosphoribosyltransferase [Nitrospira sp.]|nr:hypoxanthine phosphoribosyltransferase [Nitrospira sp.]
MERIYGKPIITQADMHKRIRELGSRISEDYTGKALTLVGVLKGAFAFYADLVRAIDLPLTVDFLVVSSYGAKAKTSGRVKIISDLTTDIKRRDVLLVEDIVDSGMTLSFLKKKLMARHPESLKVCALLDKPERRKAGVVLDYVGFSIPNKYVVGYGLDYQDKYRNLPYIAVLDKVSE